MSAIITTVAVKAPKDEVVTQVLRQVDALNKLVTIAPGADPARKAQSRSLSRDISQQLSQFSGMDLHDFEGASHQLGTDGFGDAQFAAAQYGSAACYPASAGRWLRDIGAVARDSRDAQVEQAFLCDVRAAGEQMRRCSCAIDKVFSSTALAVALMLEAPHRMLVAALTLGVPALVKAAVELAVQALGTAAAAARDGAETTRQFLQCLAERLGATASRRPEVPVDYRGERGSQPGAGKCTAPAPGGGHTAPSVEAPVPQQEVAAREPVAAQEPVAVPPEVTTPAACPVPDQQAPAQRQGPVQQTVPVQQQVPVQEAAPIQQRVPAQERVPVQQPVLQQVPVQQQVPLQQLQPQQQAPMQHQVPVQQTIPSGLADLGGTTAERAAGSRGLFDRLCSCPASSAIPETQRAWSDLASSKHGISAGGAGYGGMDNGDSGSAAGSGADTGDNAAAKIVPAADATGAERGGGDLAAREAGVTLTVSFDFDVDAAAKVSLHALDQGVEALFQPNSQAAAGASSIVGPWLRTGANAVMGGIEHLRSQIHEFLSCSCGDGPAPAGDLPAQVPVDADPPPQFEAVAEPVEQQVIAPPPELAQVPEPEPPAQKVEMMGGWDGDWVPQQGLAPEQEPAPEQEFAPAQQVAPAPEPIFDPGPAKGPEVHAHIEGSGSATWGMKKAGQW